MDKTVANITSWVLMHLKLFACSTFSYIRKRRSWEFLSERLSFFLFVPAATFPDWQRPQLSICLLLPVLPPHQSFCYLSRLISFSWGWNFNKMTGIFAEMCGYSGKTLNAVSTGNILWIMGKFFWLFSKSEKVICKREATQHQDAASQTWKCFSHHWGGM